MSREVLELLKAVEGVRAEVGNLTDPSYVHFVEDPEKRHKLHKIWERLRLAMRDAERWLARYELEREYWRKAVKAHIELSRQEEGQCVVTEESE